MNNSTHKIATRKVLQSVVEISQGSATEITFRLYLTQERLGDEIGRAGDVAFHNGTNGISIREKSGWKNISILFLSAGSYLHPLRPHHVLGFECDSTPIWYHESEWLPPKFKTIQEIVSQYAKGLGQHFSELEPVKPLITSNSKRKITTLD
jgi:hypothetical protein